MSNKPMKNLFLGSMRKKQMFIRILSLVVFVSVISFVLYEGTKKSVALDADGKQLEISTHAKTVADVLEDENIVIADKDKVSPSLDTKIVNDMTIKWEQAKEYAVVVDGKEQQVITTEKRVEDVLQEAGVNVTANDKVSLALDEKLKPGETVDVQKAFQLTLTDGTKKAEKVWSTRTTVANFLEEQGVKLNKFDRLNVKESDIVKSGQQLTIVRVEKKVDTVEEEIEFSTENRNDGDLAQGEQKVITEGENGKVERTYEVVVENGKVVARNLQKEDVLKDPVKKVVALGTKEPVAQVSRGTAQATAASTDNSGSGAPTGGQEFYVEATAYTPYCDGCSGISAAGIDLRSNPGLKLIAVDPNVIPLGSKVWVEGYGYAIAGDTGGAIKGNIIDLLVQTKEEAYSWGRRQVRIKVLN